MQFPLSGSPFSPILDEQILTEARAKLPPVAGGHAEGQRTLLEMAVTSLLAQQVLTGAAAQQLCANPNDDAAFEYLVDGIRRQAEIHAHLLDVYRAVRDKPEVVS